MSELRRNSFESFKIDLEPTISNLQNFISNNITMWYIKKGTESIYIEAELPIIKISISGEGYDGRYIRYDPFIITGDKILQTQFIRMCGTDLKGSASLRCVGLYNKKYLNKSFVEASGQEFIRFIFN